LPADATDEYIKIEESTVIESLKRFCHIVVEVFAQQYLRSPNVDDVARLLRIGKHREFPGMLGLGRFWKKDVLHDIMTAYIIMHNMIIVDERDVDVAIHNHMEAPTPQVERVIDENT
ncbi:hypothetical protein Ddye_023440, partial [Dipteronia dyeriana]